MNQIRSCKRWGSQLPRLKTLRYLKLKNQVSHNVLVLAKDIPRKLLME